MSVVTLSTIRQPFPGTKASLGSVDMGPMSVTSHHWPAGFDVTEILRAACGDVLCPVPHYFIVTSGSLELEFTDDGSKEVARAGDVAYLRPGHTCRAIEDLQMVELSPANMNAYLQARIAASGNVG